MPLQGASQMAYGNLGAYGIDDILRGAATASGAADQGAAAQRQAAYDAYRARQAQAGGEVQSAQATAQQRMLARQAASRQMYGSAAVPQQRYGAAMTPRVSMGPQYSGRTQAMMGGMMAPAYGNAGAGNSMRRQDYAGGGGLAAPGPMMAGGMPPGAAMGNVSPGTIDQLNNIAASRSMSPQQQAMLDAIMARRTGGMVGAPFAGQQRGVAMPMAGPPPMPGMMQPGGVMPPGQRMAPPMTPGVGPGSPPSVTPPGGMPPRMP